MKRLSAIILTAILIMSVAVFAGDKSKTQVARILEHKSSLNLTDSQVKKLQIIDSVAQEKMGEAKMHADMRLREIEQFSSDWSRMNGTAVRTIIKEYYDYMADYKMAEVNAILQARAILDSSQLKQFHQLVSIEALMLDMEQQVALR